MNFLKWYSPIVVSLSAAIIFVEWVVSSFEDTTSFLALVLYVPIAVYLWRILAVTK